MSMTTSEKIANVQVLVENDPDATEAVVTVYLSKAEAAIMARLYRAHGGVPGGVRMPQIYDQLQCDLAADYFLKRGAQGETVHNENGVNRTYASADSDDLLKNVMPYAKCMATSNTGWV